MPPHCFQEKWKLALVYGRRSNLWNKSIRMKYVPTDD